MAVGVDKRKYLRPETVALLNSMSLRARLVVEGYIIGHHRSPYHGFSVEFAEHRSYGPGDEIKHIDWKLFGKTDRLYVKRYEEETNLRAHIILDTSKSMLYNSGEVSKLSYANSLAASLITFTSACALGSFDSIGVLWPIDTISSLSVSTAPTGTSPFLKAFFASSKAFPMK